MNWIMNILISNLNLSYMNEDTSSLTASRGTPEISSLEPMKGASYGVTHIAQFLDTLPYSRPLPVPVVSMLAVVLMQHETRKADMEMVPLP